MSARSFWVAVLSVAVFGCKPVVPPDPPTGVTAVAGVRQAAVRWTAPPQEALAPITYTVVASPGGASASTAALQATVAGLSNASAYTFTVTARNSAGESAPSAPSAPVTTPGVPAAPQAVAATAGDGRAQVTWTAGADGGSPVTSFTVVAFPGGATATSSTTPATVGGLTNGGTYTFTVEATNAVGDGPSSAPSAPVSPVAAVAFDTTRVPVGPTGSALDPTWRWGPMMHIFVRAYRDSDGDGEGDLAGLIEKLDYLKDLGIRGILLLPVNPSQDRDHGYLVTNYRDIAPEYGSLQDMDRLIAEAHARGIGVMLDMVVDYSGAAHPGFVSARADAGSPWRSWYQWSLDGPGSSMPTWYQTPTGWYYAPFGEMNPAFDFHNQAVRAYHRDTLRFWLNRGIDGYRIDAAETLLDGPEQVGDLPGNEQVAGDLARVAAEYPNRLVLCEAPWAMGRYASSEVCGGGFLFDFVWKQAADGSWVHGGQAAVEAAAQGETAEQATSTLASVNWMGPMWSLGTFLSNHDNLAGARPWNQLGGDTPAYRLAAATMLLMPGTPYLYYGEELGMAETLFPSADPSSDHHHRGVMSWSADPDNAGFSASRTLDGPRAITDPDDEYLKPVPNSTSHNVEAEQGDPSSLLEHYRGLIALRNGHDALARGLYRSLYNDAGAIVFERSHSDEELIVAINYAGVDRELQITIPPGPYDAIYGYNAAGVPPLMGGDTVVIMPPQSVAVYRQARQDPPLGDLYVSGTGSPDPENHLAYLGQNRYQGTVFLPAGTAYLSIGSSGEPWVNIGAVGGLYVETGAPAALEQTDWAQAQIPGVFTWLLFDVPSDGLYQLDLVADDPYQPVLTVTGGEDLPDDAVWHRPAQPQAPAPTGLSWLHDPDTRTTWFFSDGELLALYNNAGNTFIEFWVDGVNLIGGYARGLGRSNWGPAVKGHGTGYPYGQINMADGSFAPWEGFWSGYNYIDRNEYWWSGLNGNPHGEQSFDVQPTADGRLDMHVVTLSSHAGTALYTCDVHYHVSRDGIGVRDHVTVLTRLEPLGPGDSGGQFLMTQVDTDLDPALPFDREQPDQYFQLAFDGKVQDVDPYPPYNSYSPSVEYTDTDSYDPPWVRMYQLPDAGRVTANPVSYLTATGRKSRPMSLALRIDTARSKLPQMELYSEVNGKRDYFNMVYTAVLGVSYGSDHEYVDEGTEWTLYGDLRAWRGAEPEVLRELPMLSDGIPDWP